MEMIRRKRGEFYCRVCPVALCAALAFWVGKVSIAGSSKSDSALPLKLTSSAFAMGEKIPQQHTCDGADASPPLSWSDPPAGTQSFAVIAADPDAPVGTWVHWVLYDLPADARGLGAGIAKQQELANGARQGKNDFGRIGYGGPCPPPGKPHRYFFKLYALKAKLGLKAGATKAEVEKAMQGHILAQGDLMGRYGRS
jgi:Raf kinase inhibitor-like YbhB/YbcL family protein